MHVSIVQHGLITCRMQNANTQTQIHTHTCKYTHTHTHAHREIYTDKTRTIIPLSISLAISKNTEKSDFYGH